MLLIAALATLAVILACLGVEAFVIVHANAPAHPSAMRLGELRDVERVAIPRVIWTYWDILPPPALVARCLQAWQRYAPDHEIRLVERASMSRWLPPGADLAQFASLPAYRQADWLRLQLLIHHGGIWMDGSTLLTTNLDWVHSLHDQIGAGVVGFYIDRYTRDAHFPIIENWFLATPAHDPFIVAWADELDGALALGEQRYLDDLRIAGELDALAQGIPEDMRSYLIMHLAAARVRRRSPESYRLIVQRAEDVAFAFHAALRWRKRHLYARLALTPAPHRRPSLVKLRSGDRSVMEQGLARGWVWRRSLLAELLALP